MMPGRRTNLVSFRECQIDPVFYLISDSPEDFEHLLFRPHSSGRIIETFMDYFSCFGELGRKLRLS